MNSTVKCARQINRHTDRQTHGHIMDGKTICPPLWWGHTIIRMLAATVLLSALKVKVNFIMLGHIFPLLGSTYHSFCKLLSISTGDVVL